MKKIKLTIISSLILSLAVIASFFVYAYFYQSEEKLDERTLAEVKVDTDLYFMQGSTRYEGKNPTLLQGDNEFSKKGVYEVILANLNDPRHLNNLRIDFKVNSTTDTYFRIKLYDSVVVMNPNGDRETILTNTGIKYRYKEYLDDVDFADDDGDSEFWFLDKKTNWFYYKGKVNGLTEELIIPFIYGTTSFEGPTQNRRLEVLVIVEAVQAHRGPVENWNLDVQPWPGGGEW